MHIFAFLLISLVLATDHIHDSIRCSASNRRLLPLFSPLLLNESVAYHVEGQFCIRGIGSPTTRCTPCSLTSQPSKKRISYNFTNSGGGINTILEDNSYFFGFAGAGDVCFSTNTTYADQVGWYSKAVSQNKSTRCDALYLGNVFDNGGCGIPISVNYRTSNGIITAFAFSERYPVEADRCGYVEASVVYDMKTLQTRGNFDKYFEIFSTCTSPSVLDFCNTLFPGTGPCTLTPPVNPPPYATKKRDVEGDRGQEESTSRLTRRGFH